MWSDIRYRLRALFRRDAMERELADELQFHLDQDAVSDAARTQQRTDAQRRADFGGVEPLKEACRDARGIGAIDRLRQDLRYAWRMLVKHPAFSAAVVATLGLGIGGATTMFGVVDGVVLKPLPYRDADRIVRIGRSFGGVRVSATSAVDFDALRERARSLRSVAITREETADVRGDTEPVRVSAAVVSASFFDVLGVSPARGQLFASADDRPGARPIAIVSERLARRLEAEPGASVVVNGTPHVVVGVMPRRFRGPEALGQENVDLWLPLGRITVSADADDAAFGTIAALAPAGDVGSAAEELAGIGSQLSGSARQPPGTSTPPRFWIAPLHGETVGDAGSGLWLIFGAVSLLLVLACTNVAHLFLVRATERTREIAVRTALGAGRGRIARQLMTETMVFGLLGGLLGIALSYLGIATVRAWAPADLPRTGDLEVDVRVLLFAVAVAGLAGLVFGIAPAVRARRSSFGTLLRGGSLAVGPARNDARSRAGLVVMQTAIAVMLVAGAALLANSVWHLSRVPPGFDPADVAWLDITLPERAYAGAPPKLAFFEELLRSTRALPGIESAALIQGRPLGGGNSVSTVAPEGRLPAEGESATRVPFHVVSPGYFETLRVPIVDGRDFTEADRGSSRVAVVSRAFASRFWPDERAVGKRFWMGRLAADAPLVEVVGVAEDVRQYALADAPIPMVYRAFAQAPRAAATVVARHGSQGSAAAIAQLRNAASTLDPALPVDRHGTLSAEVSRSIREPRFRALALSAFGLIACAIACVGLYGALAWTVRAREREIGVRMALGANPAGLGWTIVRRGLLLASLGIVIGLAGATATSRILASMLFGITPTDGPTFLATAGLMLGVSFVACWVPARRASRVDPLAILKGEV